jgi:nitroimidazol reductase NimA-like FMN-containing flavoprotein (pyridoxamine 5'-phosphate oxidase superfamily)
VLTDDECMALLRTNFLGRIGLSVSALPVVVPVNYLVDGERIVICSEPGAKLEAARHGLVACLEIDEFDPLDHAGWSVLATGRLTEITAPEDLAVVQELPFRPWIPMSDPHFLSLSIELLSGRRLHHG